MSVWRDSAVSLAHLVKKPHHTAFCVTDFETARSFFVDLLGFVIEMDGERSEPALATVTAVPGARVRLAVDLPPLKWSSLKYGFAVEDRIDGKEEAYS